MFKKKRILFFSTKGFGSNEDDRMKTLLSRLDAQHFHFDPSSVKAKCRSFLGILSSLRKERPDVVVMEGSGLAGGAALLVARMLYRVPFVVSSGDAVAPFLSARLPLLTPAFSIYEKCLYRFSNGFIGWTPYLVGRALTMGAPRAMTAEHWNFFSRSPEQLAQARAKIRTRYNIPADAIVIGIVGSLAWNERYQYCYGMELVKAAKRTDRKNLFYVIAGDGEGLGHLKKEAQGMTNVLFTGRVPLDEVPDVLACFDIGSLPQSLDRVGSFRYTTKISEYKAAALPIITCKVPMAYDLDGGWFWRLSGKNPWGEEFISALSGFLATLTTEEILRKKNSLNNDLKGFDREAQISRVSDFLTELCPWFSGAAMAAAVARSHRPR